MSPMKIVFAGTPEPAAYALQQLIADPRLDVVGVLTQPDAQKGRGRTLRPSAVAALAEENGLPVHKWPSLKAGAATDESDDPRKVLQSYAEQGVTAVAVVAYGNLIPKDLLETFEHGWINLHFSLLPRWRGAAPVQAAIAAGDEKTGATIFRIEQGLDTGPMISHYIETIGIQDTADDLLTRLTLTGRELLADSLVSLHEGTAELTEQNDAQSTHAAKIHSADARIDWTQPAAVIQRTARAHTPAPGAWTILEEQRYKIGMMLPSDTAAASDVDLVAGQVAFEQGIVLVGTGDGEVLEITRIQPPGKKMMNAADWARGQQALLEQRPTCETISHDDSATTEGDDH